MEEMHGPERSSYKRGGKVKKTGRALLHKGEEVVPPGKARKMRKAMRKGKRKSGR